MKERPILFSAPMVKAILDGRKTVTRRVVKPQPPANAHQVETWHHPDTKPRFFTWTTAGEISDQWEPLPCPYGQPGEKLWVRETWMDLLGTGIERKTGDHGRYAYAADTPPGSYGDDQRKAYGLKWRPSIHMPRAASRITLEVTDVRVERLGDVSESDARAEGVQSVAEFKELWASINGPSSWDANPWVWVVEFKRVEGGAA